MPYEVIPISERANVTLVIFSGMMTAQDVSNAVAEVVILAEDCPRPAYQIGDFREADGTFSTVMAIVRTFPTMNRIYKDEGIVGPIVVNDLNNPWLRLSSSLAEKMNLRPFITFATIDDALLYIDKQTANSN